MNINCLAPINQLSYGLTSANLIANLVELGHKIALWPIGFDGRYLSAIGKMDCHPKFRELLEECVKNVMYFDYKAPSLRIWHANDLAQHVGEPSIGFPIFELNSFRDYEVVHLKGCDYLLVCSEWAKRILVENNIKSEDEIGVVPLGVDRSIFHENVRRAQSEKVIFLNIGKWEVRKGHDILGNLFKRAFENNNDVQLWMMNHNIFYSDEDNVAWMNSYKRELGDKVEFIKPVVHQDELASVMASADYGVFPSRAEGFNLEPLEMMAVGKKSLVLNYAGVTEYCTEENSFLVTPTALETAIDGFWFNGQGEWANISKDNEDEIIHCLRSMYEKGKTTVDKKCVETSVKFSWKNSAKRLVDNLENWNERTG